MRGYARDTPPPLHLLCKHDIFFLLFRLSIWLICEPLGEPGLPQRKNPRWANQQGGHSCNFANHWGETGGKPGDRGVYRVYPGRTRSYGSVIFRICQHLFFIFGYFLVNHVENGLTPVPKPPIIQGYATCSRENTMFEAVLLICLAAAPQECVELSDTRGPYASKPDCMRRVDEMAEFATGANLFELNIKWKCTNTKGTPT